MLLTMARLPPGPRFLLSQIHYIAIPPAFVFLVTSLTRAYAGVHIHPLVVILAYLLSPPIFWLVYRTWRDVSIQRAAAAHGAVVAPAAKLTRDIMRKGQNGYPRSYY